MKETIKFILFTMLTFICLVCLVACKNDSKVLNYKFQEFNKTEAIKILIKSHPDFPSNPDDAITKVVPIGEGTTKVKHTTKVEQFSKNIYIITLTEDWEISSFAKSYWKYKVTPNGISLMESVDNRNILTTIK